MSKTQNISLRKNDWTDRYNMSLDDFGSARPDHGSSSRQADSEPQPLSLPAPEMTHMATIELLGKLPE